MTFKV